MRIRHLIIIALILSVLTISAVNASQDMDNLTITDTQEDPIEEDVLEQGNDELISQQDDEILSEDYQVSVYVNDEIYPDKDFWVAQVIDHDYMAKGNVSVSINDTVMFNKKISECNYSWEYSCYFVNYPDLNGELPIGEHRILAKYEDDLKNVTASGTIIVKNPVSMNLSSECIVDYGYFFDLFDYYGFKGTLAIFVNGSEAYRKNSTGEDDHVYVEWNDLNLKDYDYGPYDVKAIYNRTGVDGPFVCQGTVEVTYAFAFGIDAREDEGEFVRYDSGSAEWGSDETLEIELPKNAANKPTVLLNNKPCKVKVENGIAKVTIKTRDLDLGTYVIYANYSDASHPMKSINYTLTVTPKIRSNFFTAVGDQNIVIFEAPKKYNGKIRIYTTKYDDDYNVVDDKLLKTANVKDGSAYVVLKNLGLKDDFLHVYYDYGNYSFNDTLYFSVEKNSKKFSASINHNLFVQGDPVIIKFSSRVSKGAIDVQIDGAGYSRCFEFSKGKLTKSFSNLKAGTHIIGIHFENGKYRFTKNFIITIKPAKKVKLTLKKANVKRSAKKLTLSATLKIDGKKVKGKVLKFKFKGKTYKAKTNKKGVAKVTIKKSVLKKLKRGKKITYKVTFVKNTVKKTVKVKR